MKFINKTYFIALLTVLNFNFMASFAAEEISSEKQDKLEKIFDFIGLKETIRKENDLTANELLEGFDRSFEECLNNNARKETTDYIEELLGFDTNKQYFFNLYAADFNEEELDAIIKFSQSAVGKKVLMKLPNKLTESVRIRNAIYKKSENDFVNKIQSIISENLDGQCLNGKSQS